MYSGTLAFLIGIISLHGLVFLPSLSWFFSFIILFALIWYFFSPARIICQFIIIALIGCAFAVVRAESILAWTLPTALETKTLTVTGRIASLPEDNQGSKQFEFLLATLDGSFLSKQPRIRLAWYQSPAVSLKPGDTWQFQVRLKRPHGLLNPGGFDYEQWLFVHKIRATGYVVNNNAARLLHPNSWHNPLDRLRNALQQKIHSALNSQATAGIITALIMGAQDAITPAQWQIMRATGTNHLVAIAGVHIGFVSGFFYWVINFLWRRSLRLVMWTPAINAATSSALIAAFFYSALAGFSLPTLRALSMLSLFSISVFLKRALGNWNAVILALLIIIIYEPFEVFSVSFWLSFGAVLAILFGISGRLSPRGLWWQYGRVQWVITIGLIPISLLLFAQTSLVSFIANLLAVPAVGILVLPICLIGAILLFIVAPWGQCLLLIAAKIVAILWVVLAWFATIKGAIWSHSLLNGWIGATTLMGIILLIAPKGIPARWLGICWLLPLFYNQASAPKAGQVWFTLLDVGQGLATVIRTQHHTLIFDTGPKISATDDAGKRVILPFLQAMRISLIDKMIISHGDSDHIGGANSLLAQIPITQVLTSVPQRFNFSAVALCQAGQHWQWDGVKFTLLHPVPEFFQQNNNGSCVLRIEQGQSVILLTGDIEKIAEDSLLERVPNLLAATILVAPHHGSRTSSSIDFVKTVMPTYVLFPVGYKNRFNFPSQGVIDRYLTLGAKLLNSAENGAITFKINAQGQITSIESYRQLHWKIWYSSSAVR